MLYNMSLNSIREGPSSDGLNMSLILVSFLERRFQTILMRVEYVAAANPNKIRVTKLIGPDAD